MNKPIGIHWFRYDLRLKNNPSLSNLSKKVDKVIPIFIFDPDEILDTHLDGGYKNNT